MKSYVTALIARMNEALADVARVAENQLQRAEQSYLLVQQTLKTLREFIANYTFKDADEEIQFFKDLKPQFLRELIFFMELYYLEAHKPANRDNQVSYLLKEVERIDLFFARNRFLRNYYLTGKTSHDNLFFLRENNDNNLPFLPEYSLDMDPTFCTVHSSRLAQIQAFEQLTEHIDYMVLQIQHPELSLAHKEQGRTMLTWTDSKAALIELVYALHSRGAVNNGKGDIKQIMESLELMFNVQLGNFYRSFQNMRIRKKNRTAYLDTLKESLEHRMDETDVGNY